MKHCLLLAFTTLAFALGPQQTRSAPAQRTFELRTYHVAPGKFDALHARFRNHATTLLPKHGMTLVGFWVPTDPARADTLVYLVAHESRAAADRSWTAFRADPEWIRVKAESEKDGPLVTNVESVFMSPTDYSAMK